MTDWLRACVVWASALSLWYFLAINAAYFLLLALSALELRSYLRRLRYGSYDLLFRDPRMPEVSVVIPAYNEAAAIATSVRGALNLNYPSFEVIVVNDGSTDATLDALRRGFRLVRAERAMKPGLRTQEIRGVYRSLELPNLLVVDKANGGKSDALNAAINACRNPYFCAVDADVVLEEDALLRVMRPIVEDPERVVAVGGIVRVANGCEVANARVAGVRLPGAILPMLQVVEYLRAFLSGRTGFSGWNGLLIISGAFGVFSTKWAVAAGGYNTATVGEDMELVCAMHALLREMRQGYRIVFIADPVCWTLVPESLGILQSQRRRWQRGLLETLWSHRRMFLRPRYGLLAFFSFPFFVVFEGLGPLLEAAGYLSTAAAWALGAVSKDFVLAFFTLAVLAGMLLNLCAILLEECTFRRYPRWRDILRLLCYGLLEGFGYRQLTVFFRCQGLWDFLAKRKGWGPMRRPRFGEGAAAAALALFVSGGAGASPRCSSIESPADERACEMPSLREDTGASV